MRLLSWNIHIGIGLDGALDLRRISDLIRRVDPDIAALQEVDAYRSRTHWVNQWRTIGDATGLSAFHGPGYTTDNEVPPPEADARKGPHPARWIGQYGNAVLTRLPVRAIENHGLALRPGGTGPIEPRGCLEVTCEGFTLLATHWGLDPAERELQSIDITAIADRAAGPVVILGDLNAIETSPEIGRLAARWRDAGASAGATFPADGPHRRIDYCWLPPDWTVKAATVLPTAASDHCPLVVDVEPL